MTRKGASASQPPAPAHWPSLTLTYNIMPPPVSPQNPEGRVVVVGSLNVDFIWSVPTLPRPGETMSATRAKTEFGGKGANQAFAAARYGAAVTLIGAVGADSDGRRYIERLRDAAIDVSHVATVADCATGAAHVYVDPEGENTIVVHAGANAPGHRCANRNQPARAAATNGNRIVAARVSARRRARRACALLPPRRADDAESIPR